MARRDSSPLCVSASLREPSARALPLALLALLAAGCPSRSPTSPGAHEPGPLPDGTLAPGSFRPIVVEPSGRLYLTFADELSSSFRLVNLRFALDDDWIVACGDGERSLDAKDPILVYDGRLSVGEHSLHVDLTYRGAGYGVFSYLSGYTFRVRSRHDFDLPAAFVALHARAFENGDLETPLEDRPQLAFEDRSTDPPRVGPRPGCPWADE